MTQIHDRPEDFATTALAGFCSANARTVRLIRGGCVRATATPAGKVALVVGGGSGHYPAFAGFVGPGLADAAVAGDVMNFGLAAERLRAEGIDVRILAVTDDVASAPADKASLRRGVAGDLVVFKIVGAAAEAGLDLAAVERIGRLANARTSSFGVAFTGCTLPGATEPLFTVPKARMGVGLGIHGEPGISEEAILPAAELAAFLVAKLLAERPAGASGRVAVVLNGLGCTKYEELFVLWSGVESALAKAGATVVAPEVGEYVTSLDMAGVSLTLTWLDDELERHWLAPSDVPVLRRGSIIPTVPAPPTVEDLQKPLRFGPASAPSRDDGRCIAGVIGNVAAALREAEDELGRIDAIAGDGDHGQGMTRGSAAAAEAAAAAVAAGAGAASVLACAGDAWADRAGGTSGALWGLALRTWSGALSDDAALDAAAVARGAREALAAVMRLGRGRVGDKTLVDAFDPFVATLAAEVERGQPLGAAWTAAAAAATRAAEATAALAPKLGRARPHAARSVGHPDAGAVSLALCARVAGRDIAS